MQENDVGDRMSNIRGHWDGGSCHFPGNTACYKFFMEELQAVLVRQKTKFTI